MNLAELENWKLSVLNQISDPISEIEAINLISSFYESLLTDFSIVISTPYFFELLPHYFHNLSCLQVSGDDLQVFNSIIEKAKPLASFAETSNISNELSDQIKRLEADIALLTLFLEGKNPSESSKGNVSFPVLLLNNSEMRQGYNDYFSVNLEVNKKSKEDEFLIFPSSIVPDPSLLGQLKIAWNYAKNYFVRYHRGKIKSFTIIVRLNNQNAAYTGQSAGAALTICLLRELFNYYDKLTDISPLANISITGSIDKNGLLIKLENYALSVKVKTIFYSDIDYFIVPIDNFQNAIYALKDLLLKYPSRKINIIPASSIEDILDRRKLFNVGRQNYGRWLYRNSIRHKYSLVPFLILILVVLYVIISKQDNNISELSATKNILLVKNKFGEVLWEKRMSLPNEGDLNRKTCIFDKEGDGKNELFLCSEDARFLKNPDEAGRLAFYDNDGNIIWRQKYSFNIRTKKGSYSGNYNVNSIIGIIESGAKKDLLVTVQHPAYWPSAIIKVDLETGEQIGDIFWHPGTIIGGTIYDINNDGIAEILCTAVNNGMRGSAIFILSSDKITGSAPSTDRYKFDGIPINEFMLYAIFPVTDISVYYKNKYNIPIGKPVLNATNERILFDIREGGSSELYQHGSIKLALNFELNEIEPILLDRFITVRDQLVDDGILQLPYTGTDEYSRMLKNSLLIWQNNKFEKFYKSKTNL